MRKIIIFCECYVQYKYALQLATQNYHDRSVTIIIPLDNKLVKFLNGVNERVFHSELNIIYIVAFQSSRAKAKGINRLLSVLSDIIKERRYLENVWRKHFAELAGRDVYFFSRGFNGLTYYLLRKLIKRNRIVYVALESLALYHWMQYTPRNITELTSLVISRLIYGRNITLGQLPYHKGFLFMPDKFIGEVDRIMSQAEVINMVKGFDLSQFKVPTTNSCSVIFLDQPLVGGGYISDADAYRRELTSILNILSKYYTKNEIGIKYHPEYDGDGSLENVGDILPSFIPAELLYNNNIKLYLTVMSWSIAYAENGLVVSLVDLITFKDDEVKHKLKEAFVEISKSSKPSVLFPKTLDEFEQILIGSKEVRE